MACASSSRVAPQELTLEVRSPSYAAFSGDSDTIEVRGAVSDPFATVWVEGREVNVGGDGTFRVDLPVHGPYRVIDVEAARPDSHLRQRIPVFAGNDPMDTWPGGLSARVTPLGLQALGDTLEPTIEGLNFVDAIFGILPSIETDGFTFVPLESDPGTVDVRLAPSETGLDMTIALLGIEFEAAYDIPILGSDTLTLGLAEVVIGIEVQPEVDASGMLWLAFGDSTLTLADPTLETGTIDPVILEDLLDDALGGLGPLASGAIDGLLGGIGAIPLGGPFEFDLDLLGSPMSFGIDGLYTDLDGLALVLGLDLGGQGTGAGLAAPAAAEAHWAAHLVLSVHEGVFQLLLNSEIFDLLSQDLELGGMFGNILALPITSLPGGSGAPSDATGWCLAINPGDARVARLEPGSDHLARLYLPDFRFDIGYQQGSTTCYDWLEASVALEVGLGIEADGAIDLALDIGDGAVLSYMTEAPYDEQGVIDGLGGLLGLATGFLGGDALGFDLGSLLGGGDLGLGLGELQIVEMRPVFDENGEPREGVANLSVRIF